MAKEWVKDAPNQARLVYNLCVETSKAWGSVEQKNKELTTKLTTDERGRKSAKVSLKNAQMQTEEQRQKLHYTEIELATAKQQVVDLKAKLKKAKEAAQVAQAAVDAVGQKFYDLRVRETEVRLTDELAGVCKDYCLEVWIEALNQAGAPATSKWRKAENVYYLEDL